MRISRLFIVVALVVCFGMSIAAFAQETKPADKPAATEKKFKKNKKTKKTAKEEVKSPEATK